MSGRVSFSLLETKLLDALDRLMDPAREIGTDVHGKWVPLAAEQMCGLHLGVTKLMQALCEGTDRKAEDRILSQCQLDNFAQLSGRYYERWNAAQKQVGSLASDRARVASSHGPNPTLLMYHRTFEHPYHLDSRREPAPNLRPGPLAATRQEPFALCCGPESC